MERLNENAWIAGVRDAAALITFEDLNTQSDLSHESRWKDARYMTWGERNTLPDERELLIRNNNIVGQLLNKRISMTLGQGLQAYRPVYEQTKEGMRERKDFIRMPARQEDFFEKIEVNDLFQKNAKNFFVHGGLLNEFLMNKGAKLNRGEGRVNNIQAMESRHMRISLQDASGKSPNWYWSGYWSKLLRQRQGLRNYTVKRIPAWEKGKEKGKFIRYHGNPLTYDDYYYHPEWWGSKRWISLANSIPEFHINNLENGYNIRWHIEVPEDYFDGDTTEGMTEQQKKDAETARQSVKQDFTDSINNFLAGLKNAGRTIFTTYELQRETGKDMTGVKITPLNYDMKDDALLKLFEKSNQAVISAQGLHPTLASIETAGKLASGSEIRNAFLMFLAIDTPLPRRLLLKDIYLASRLNGWDKSIKFCFKDIELTTLSEDKSGKKESTANNE